MDYPAFSVQFHPGVSTGPRDTAFLFGRFLTAAAGKRRGDC
jgi:carbamoylphosphate synthase small subunit